MPTCFVEMDPVGKQRPRLGRGGRVYTPDATRKAEQLIASQWWAPPIPLEIPVMVRMTVFYARPASHLLTGGGLNAAGRRLPVPMKRPDLDNVVKLVLDALNGVAYRDDSQILSIEANRKWASAQPGVLIKVRELRPTELEGYLR